MRLFTALIIAMMLIGCSATKRLNRSANIVAVDSTTLVHHSDSVATSQEDKTAETVENLSVNEDLEVEIKIYDTTQPVDSATGKPPLKQEINAKKRKQTNVESKHNEKISQKDSTATSSRNTTSQYKWLTKKESEQVESKTRFIFPWWGILGGIGVAILIISILKQWKLRF